jgi:hypothetical protein
MPDRKPPRLTGTERETVCALLDYQRHSFVRKVEGLSESDARRSPVPSGTSLLWLTKHLARAERLWHVRRFAGRTVQIDDDDVRDSDTLYRSVQLYRQTWTEVDAIVATSDSLDALCVNPEGLPLLNLRWILTHLVQETARHAGHADILRELIDGSAGR